jgi:V/A-type H+-transporting ATPase subunit B
MTLYCDALSIVSNRMDQIPSKDSMPGSLYSDLASIYEKAVQFPSGGSITIIAVTTLSGGDITHAIPDNTGYSPRGSSSCAVIPTSGRSSSTPSAVSPASSSW